MRWDALFADLETAAAGEWLRERDAEIAERTRAKLGRVRLDDRLRAVAERGSAGDAVEVAVRVLGAGTLRGEIARVTDDWFLMVTPTYEWVVAIAAVLGFSGLPPAARTPESRSAVSAGLGWAAAWRVLARDRTTVHVVRRDGETVAGVPGRVGHDFVELSDVDGLGRVAEVVPHAAIVAVRCPRDVAPPPIG